MRKPLTKETVLPFLTELKTRCDLGHAVSILKLATNMGMPCASSFSKALLSNGHVKMLGGQHEGLYKCQYNLTDGFANHFITLIRDAQLSWYKNKKQKCTPAKEKKLIPINENLLDRFTEKQLVAELKSRGFTGSMKKSVEIKF